MKNRLKNRLKIWSRGGFGGHFGGLGRPLGALGVPLGAFGAQSAPKSPSPDPCRSILSVFSAQMDPKRLLKSIEVSTIYSVLAPGSIACVCVCVCVSMSRSLPKPCLVDSPTAAVESIHTHTSSSTPKSRNKLCWPSAAPEARTTP